MPGVPAEDGGPARDAPAADPTGRQDPRAAAAGGGRRVALPGFVAWLRQSGLDPDARQLCDALGRAAPPPAAPGPGGGDGAPQPDEGGTRAGEKGPKDVTDPPDDGNTAPVNGTPQDPGHRVA
ncbi:hypothetical protein LCE31_38090, partial [Streptomyces sp. 8L]|nr:hypothetical protein [Streptomyces sp. 8L]